METFNLCDLHDATRDVESGISWCIDIGLLPNKEPKKCDGCGAENKVMWQSRSKNLNFPYCLKCSECKREVSIVKNTWFAKLKLNISQSLKLIYFWLVNVTLSIAAGECSVSATTALEYFRFCREVCYVTITNVKEKIGGEGHIVEIDEMHLCTRKYSKGRVLKNEKDTWIFGGIDRDTKKCFALRVNSRNTATLCSIIKDFILPGTKICTDGWKSYSNLEKEGFIHGVVNHNVEFINSEDRSVRAQNVEGMWKLLKSTLKREGPKTESDDLYAFEFLYRQKERSEGRTEPNLMFKEFIKHVINVYPGYGRQGLHPCSYTMDEGPSHV